MRNFVIIISLICVLAFYILCGSNIVDPTQTQIIKSPTEINIDQFPVWSPDGTKIIYSHKALKESEIGDGYELDTDSTGLYMINTDGTNNHLLVGVYRFFTDWKPTGEEIVFEASAYIYRAILTADTIKQGDIFSITVASEFYTPQWSPDGEWIAITKPYFDSYGEPGAWITTSDAYDWRFVEFARVGCWYPDSTSLFIIQPNTIDSTFLYMRVYTFEESMPRDTIDFGFDNNIEYPRLSTDGTMIAFRSTVLSPPGIWIANADGSNLHHLINGEQPYWSPDGNEILFIGNIDAEFTGDPFEHTTVWRINIDGTNLRQITFGTKPHKN